MIYFGEKLRDLRLSHNLTQQQLADKLGLSKAAISAYEQYAKSPSVEVLIKICHIFNVSADYLLGISDTMNLRKSSLTDKQMSTIRQLILEFEKCNQ